MSEDFSNFAAAMGGSGPGVDMARRQAFDDRLSEAHSLFAAAEARRALPEGHVLVACPACGAGSVVPEGARDWPCPTCGLLLAPYKCAVCLTPAVIARAPFAPAKGKSWCEKCERKVSGWQLVRLEGLDAALERGDLLAYGAARAAALLYPARRAIRGRVLGLDGPSGIAVGEGTIVLDRDAVRLLIGKSKALHEVPYEAVTSLQVAGRGEMVIKSGGGWVGGGFGPSAALQGAFMADVLNFLTTIKRKVTETIVHVQWTGGAMTLLTTTFTPEQLAALIEPAVERLRTLHEDAPAPAAGSIGSSVERAASATPQGLDPAARLQKLESLREAGLVSEEEYREQRGRILSEI